MPKLTEQQKKLVDGVLRAHENYENDNISCVNYQDFLSNVFTEYDKVLGEVRNKVHDLKVSRLSSYEKVHEDICSLLLFIDSSLSKEVG